MFSTANLFDSSANPRDSTAKVDIVVKHPKNPVPINNTNHEGNGNNLASITSNPKPKLPKTLTV